MDTVVRNVFVVDRPDYLTNKNAATIMASRIEGFYHERGLTDVKVWLEPRSLPNTDGETLNVHYDIRSNLEFRVPKAGITLDNSMA